MSPDRHAVAQLVPRGTEWTLSQTSPAPRGLPGPSPTALPTPTHPVTLARYAGFKYGDTTHLESFAEALVRTSMPSLHGTPGPLYVTSSGYGFTPPAAASLLEPAVGALRRAGLDARPFHTHRDSITPADYATLNPEERGKALSSEQLHASLPAGALRGATVLGLDDVVVTGVHERALELALRRDGAARVVHAYLVDASGAACSPQVESWLNGPAGTEPASLLSVARSGAFAPNSRFLKAVLRLPAAQRARVLRELSPGLLGWMIEGAQRDRMGLVPDLAAGMVALLAHAPRTATA